MDDLTDALHLAENSQQPRPEELATLAVAQVAPDDPVGGASFVFERHEDHAARGVGPLAADDDAGGADDATLRRRGDLGRSRKTPTPQSIAQERKRMAA